MSSRLEGHQIVSRSPHVLAAEADGEVALMSIPNGCYYALNGIASEIWRRLEQPVAVEQLAAVLIARYNGDRTQIERDLGETLDQWLSLDLITANPRDSR
jgi:hypothetical protein